MITISRSPVEMAEKFVFSHTESQYDPLSTHADLVLLFMLKRSLLMHHGGAA